MNALTKNIIRIWIALTSLFAFAIGWIALGHSEKPVALNTETTQTTTTTVIGVEFAPIPSLQDLISGQPSSNVPNFTISIAQPRLRTMGS